VKRHIPLTRGRLQQFEPAIEECKDDTVVPQNPEVLVPTVE
jgi:hypothetical protein